MVEAYMQKSPLCFLCRDQPATTPMVFVSDVRDGDRVRGFVVAACVVCLLGENFQERLQTALNKAQRQERGPWN
jgi:hypothetical protein